MNAAQILIVDDDPEIRRLLSRYVQEQGFRVQQASGCQDAGQFLVTNQIDLMVLDVMLPDGSGLDFCRDLRAKKCKVPIILLTALKEDVDRILGLEIGADDYLGKPFNPRELVARVRAVLRRYQATEPTISEARSYHFESFVVDPSTRSVLDPSGHDVELTGAEFTLLLTFLDRPGRVLSRDQLLDLTRGRDGEVQDRSIDILVSRLRRKIADRSDVQVFKTIRNGGYQFAANVEVLERH